MKATTAALLTKKAIKHNAEKEYRYWRQRVIAVVKETIARGKFDCYVYVNITQVDKVVAYLRNCGYVVNKKGVTDKEEYLQIFWNCL